MPLHLCGMSYPSGMKLQNVQPGADLGKENDRKA
jgi:hypothetical protein